MSYQFMHMETFGRKQDKTGRNVDFILAEANRSPEASAHVARPIKPTVIYGATIDEVGAIHDLRVAEGVEHLKDGRTRKIGQTTHTLATVVCSHPYTVEYVRGNQSARREVLEWERHSIAWLKRLYGDQLVSVVRHIDEAQCHIHAYAIAATPDMKALALHPGYAARKVVEKEGAREGETIKAVTKRATAAYKSAMRSLQDSYHRDVAQPCGLTRLGPARRRLSRQEWQTEKVQARALAEVATKAVQIEKVVQERVREARRVRSETATILETAKNYKSVGGRIRAIFDGLRVSSLTDRIALKFAGEVQVLKSSLQSVRELVSDEREKRRRAEQETKAVRASRSEIVAERDRALSEVRSLRSRYGLESAPEMSKGYTP